jgi:N-formylglutamate amidohydrolase
MRLYDLHRGDSALVVDVPHAGTHVPPAIAEAMDAGDAAALPDTDWHVEKLYAFAREAGATVMVATHSRYVVDLNRDPSGVALYAGADNTELVPARTFDDVPIWRDGRAPDDSAVEARKREYFTPLPRRACRRDRAREGAARPRRGPRRALDPLARAALLRRQAARPQPGHGRRRERRRTASRVSRPACWPRTAASRPVVDGRFKGGWITRRYGRPGRRHARAAARDRAERVHGRVAAVAVGRGARRRRSEALLRRLVAALSAWRHEADLRRAQPASTRSCCATGSCTRHRRARVQREHGVCRRRGAFRRLGPQVWVDDENVARAKAVLAAFAEEQRRGRTLRCAQCGEDNPATFELCWKCGRSLQ